MSGGALAGRAALVTGAGIGQAIAIELARQGADVGIHYAQSHAGAELTLSEIRQAGRRAHAIQADLSQVDEPGRVVDEAADALGGLDVAGAWSPGGASDCHRMLPRR